MNLKCLKTQKNVCTEWIYFVETQIMAELAVFFASTAPTQPVLTGTAIHYFPFSLCHISTGSLSHPIPSSAVINQNWIWAQNPIIKRLVWLGAISAAFVCVMFHWSSFLNLRVARRQMWVFKGHLWKGHCDSLLRTFKKMPLWPLTMWDPHVIHILRNILSLYVPACIFETF